MIEPAYARATDDYLYARIRARRAELVTGGLLRRAGSGEPRQALMAEYRWVFLQANAKLRRKLLPIFEFFELRLLVVALRYLALGERAALLEPLRQSLFETKIIRALENAEQTVDALQFLQEEYAGEYRFFEPLTASYLRQGPGGLEQALVGGYLQQACCLCRDPLVRQVLRYLLDMRNLQAVRKHLRWQVPIEPPLLSGGSLDKAELENIWNERDTAALAGLMKRFARQRQLPAEDADEDYLLRGLTDCLRQQGRDPLQLGVVLDYLWRCWLMAREQGVRLHGAQLSAAGAMEAM